MIDQIYQALSGLHPVWIFLLMVLVAGFFIWLAEFLADTFNPGGRQ